MTESTGSLGVKKDREMQGTRITKEHEETSEGFGYVHYLDYGDGFLCVYINQNLSKCTF